jgi:hypothetical protein
MYDNRDNHIGVISWIEFLVVLVNFLDWIKKYSVAISFLFGIFVGALTMYYGFNSKVDTLNYKFDTMQKSMDREFENVYDVLHRQKTNIDKVNKQSLNR